MQRLSGLLAALQGISPMPSDEELKELPEEGSHRLDTYAQLIQAIRQEVQTAFPAEALPILLDSFGLGDGGEVYWSTLHLLEIYPDENTLYHLIQQASSSPHPGTRKWCCLLLGRRRSLEDVPFLLERLRDAIPAVRQQALLYGIGMLAQRYPLPQAVPVVRELLSDEDKTIQKYAAEILAQLVASGTS